MKKRPLSIPADASLPIRLTRRQIYILPTRHGVLFLLVLFAMLLGSINYNNNLGFLLVFLLGGMVLVSIIHTWRNLLGLKILSVTAAPVFAGETAVFHLFVRSETLKRKGVGFGFEKSARRIETIPAGTETTASVPVETVRRGLYSSGKLIIATRFPLGLFRAWSNLDTGASVVVYPKPIAASINLIDGFDAGDDKKTTETRGVDDFKGLKQYRPGDAIQHISWKTLSRGHGMFTKEFFGENSGSVVLDYSTVQGVDMEERLSKLADMIIQVSRMETAYGLSLPGRYLPPDKGDRHKHECLKTLALFDFDE